MTLRELIQTQAQALRAAEVAGALCFGHGASNAWDEAAWLVLWRLGLPLDTDVTDDTHLARAPSQPLEAAAVRAVQALVAKRIRTRQPAAYLTGQAWLQGLPFEVDARVIVPRSFIAELLGHPANGACALDVWLPQPPARVLDMCTGSGCLGILAGLRWRKAQVDAADISADALAVARINVAKHGLQKRVRLLQSDDWAGLGQARAGVGGAGKSAGRGEPISSSAPGYDLILCNPPYVNARSMARLPAEYRAEPALALDGNRDGGADGMDFVRQLLPGAAAHLRPAGLLVLEIGNERAHFEAAFPALQSQAIWLEVSAGCDQVLLLTREALCGGAV